MFESKEDDELWKNQEEWKLQSWIFYENCGVHVLRLEDGTEINMLAERRYPLTKNTLIVALELSKGTNPLQAKGEVVHNGSLPVCNEQGVMMVETLAILDRRMAKKGNTASVFVLV
ncbi:hypothetical protein Tco_0677966 [Tanacetum coccineum]|uniref:Uncharacterized protein n=1 Tax=Tanacetum coccineum TaxID=301880 RepID=A0ABQ4XF09_9ASTR